MQKRTASTHWTPATGACGFFCFEGPRYDELRAPAMVAIRIHDRMSHSIVVVRVDPDEVKVIDPLYGRGTIPRIQFERDWKGIAINLERSGS